MTEISHKRGNSKRAELHTRADRKSGGVNEHRWEYNFSQKIVVQILKKRNIMNRKFLHECRLY